MNKMHKDVSVIWGTFHPPEPYLDITIILKERKGQESLGWFCCGFLPLFLRDQMRRIIQRLPWEVFKAGCGFSVRSKGRVCLYVLEQIRCALPHCYICFHSFQMERYFFKKAYLYLLWASDSSQWYAGQKREGKLRVILPGFRNGVSRTTAYLCWHKGKP